MELDPVLLARLQFAFTITFHIIFPSFTIGLSAFIATLLVGTLPLLPVILGYVAFVYWLSRGRCARARAITEILKGLGDQALPGVRSARSLAGAAPPSRFAAAATVLAPNARMRAAPPVRDRGSVP